MSEENKEQKKIASALKYDMGSDNAPYVVAMGSGELADKIIQKGQEHGVKVVEDRPLAKLLQSLNIGQEIPEELYHAVAQILVFISEMDSEFAKYGKR